MTIFRLPFAFIFQTLLALLAAAFVSFSAHSAEAGDSEYQEPALVAPVIAHPAIEVAEYEHEAVVQFILRTNRAVTERQAVAISEAIHEAASEFSLDPLLLVTIASVESKFNSKAVCGASRGMFQIIPRYHREKIAEGYLRWGSKDIYNVRLNAWLGAKILSEYRASTHTMRAALSKYNGSHDGSYAEKILRLYRSSKRSRL